MSLSNVTELDVLNVLLRGNDPAYRTNANNYIALFTSDPGETVAGTEANYTGYARVALPKASSWTGSASPLTNTNLIQFGACTAGTNALTHFAIVDTATGPYDLCVSGALSATLTVSAGIQPQFGPGVLSIAAD